jgi:hypothetical protein
MAAHELRPMRIGDILDATFRLYRERFLTFLLIALVVYVPYSLLLASFPSFYAAPRSAIPQQSMDREGQMQEIDPTPQISAAPIVLHFVGLALFFVVLMPLCSAAMIHSISASYLGEDLTAGQSYGRATSRLLALVGTQFLTMLVIFLGMLACVVPGVIFSLWFLVIAPVVVLESKAGPSAMGRSKELMAGNLDKGLALGFVVGVLSWIIIFGLNKLTSLVPWPHASIRLFVENLVPAILLPIQTAPWILLYYDLRIRKEAFDLQMLSEALGQPAMGEPAAK